MMLQLKSADGDPARPVCHFFCPLQAWMSKAIHGIMLSYEVHF